MSVATLPMTQALREVTEAVEKIKNDAPQNFPIAASIGDAVRQGDIYIQKIDDVTETPMFFKKVVEPAFPFQLAPGNTKGSRHCLEESAGLELYICEASEFFNAETGLTDFDASRTFQQRVATYISAKFGIKEDDMWRNDMVRVAYAELLNALNFSGPVFKVANPTTISHPEHGDWVLPAGTYRCVFQRTINAQNTIRRVLD